VPGGLEPCMARRVLIIEDDADIRTAIAEALLSEGYTVSEAGDGFEGVSCARDGPPDLILLDLMMPKMDGWAFLAAQRVDASIADIPVIVVSASELQDLYSIDAVAHLRKPFNLRVLLDAVEQHALEASQ
jgi:CheY-like chemotaxis protein